MLVISLILVRLVSSGFTNVLNKKYQQNSPKEKLSYIIYLLITGLCAILFFSSLSAFKIQINGITLLYASIYALLISVNSILYLIVISKINILLASLFVSAGGFIIPFIFGITFLKEKLTIWLILAAFLIIVVVCLPFISRRQQGSTKFSLSFIMGIIMFFVTGASGILTKIYTSDSRISSHNSYCLLTNAFILLFCVLALITYILSGRNNKQELLISFKKFTPKCYIYIILLTVCSNIGTLLNLYIVALMNISLYTIITNSTNTLCLAFVSRVILKENISKTDYIGAVLSVIAGILCVI